MLCLTMSAAGQQVLLESLDSAVFLGSCVLLAVYAVVCCIPFLHNVSRALLHPSVLREVERGLNWVEWAQGFHRPLLTKAFNASAHTVSVIFYVTVLPFLIWIVGASLGWRLCFLMTATLFVGNSLKDLVCGPRPFAVQRSNKGGLGKSRATLLMADEDSEDFQVHAKEYGLPSSHTMNTLALNLYIAHYVAESAQLSHPGWLRCTQQLPRGCCGWLSPGCTWASTRPLI